MPLAALFPSSTSQRSGGLPRAFPNPPDLPWWLALILEIVTGFTFFIVWDIVEAWWMHRVRPQSRALVLYVIVALLFLITVPSSYHAIRHILFSGPLSDEPLGDFIALVALLFRFAARFSLRRSLLEHFNGAEPIGLRLSWFMTLVFGGLYFQFHFNRINQIKRQLVAFPTTATIA